MLIVDGKRPGFRPADDLQQIAPTRGLQKATTDVYLLKQYVPTIMHACSLNKAGKLPVYYSFSYPTLLEGSPSPHNRNSSTIMLDLRDIKLLLEILLDSLKTNKNLASSDFTNICFEYFHVEPDKYGEIQLSKNIPEHDLTFLQDARQYSDRTFCATSPFWRGCIKISSS